ncbi:MAG: Crp/Fnr family transcriptional regulator [Sulfurimonas sp.]|uniref:Crp/Fnr family transcriptional regulator n=1 Tax=Sulfurimonas sp. TaxID=2022749 RepID=UPI0028CEE2DB|nr:Crp/Fnr family transcriptional regulator [Sulfurimonas sp.]MDT8338502.1 Crp/Fnr family transcriptional regulator [Sulfurimonas sp.]
MNKNISSKELISSLDFFSSLDKEQIELLSSISVIHNYSKEYVVYYEKKQNNSLLYLLKGLAKAYKIDKHNNEIFLYYIYENSLITEISNIKQGTLNSFANVALLKDSQILQIDYKKFKEEFLDKGFLCSEFINEIILNSQQLQSLINREFIFNSTAKVAMMLYDDLDIFNNLKRAEISLILHIQPETLSRVLNILKRDNIIDSKNGKIVVLDKEALISIYEE